MQKVLILGAYGQIARIIENRILDEEKFNDKNLMMSN